MRTRTERSALAAVLLAGGRSKRMGTDKCLLTLNGETLVKRTLKLLEKVVTNDCIFVSSNHVATDYPRIPDERKEEGPLEAIRSVVNYLVKSGRIAELSAVLFVPVDMPALTESVLSQLIEISRPDVDASVFENRPLPLLLRLSPKVLSSLEAASGTTQVKSVSAFLKALVVNQVSSHDVAVSLNVNTPEEWNHYCRDREQ